MVTVEERMTTANWTPDDLSVEDMPEDLRAKLHAECDVVFYNEFTLGVEPSGRYQKERWYEVGHDGYTVHTDTCDHYVKAGPLASPCWHMLRCQWHLSKRRLRLKAEAYQQKINERNNNGN